MEPVTQNSGTLVACEGDALTISTQLRLLPPSQKILILPSLQDGLRKDLPLNIDGSFDARSFIAGVDVLFQERVKAAHTFLRSSTTSQPRIVFMNGGSVAARATCISKICANLTNGDAAKAEAVFNNIAKDGVAGLKKDAVHMVELMDGTNGLNTAETYTRPGTDQYTSEEMMSASKSVDRQSTKAEQSSNGLIEVYRVSRIGQNSVRSYSGHRNHSVESFQLGHPTIVSARPHDSTMTTAFTSPSFGEMPQDKGNAPKPFSAPSEQSYTESEDDEDLDMLLSLNSSTPVTPVVVYGEACVVAVQTTPPTTPAKSLREVKSMDLLPPPLNMIVPDFYSKPGKLTRSKSSLQLRSPPFFDSRKEQPRSKSVRYSQLPTTIFMKASKTTIKKTPSNSPRSRSLASSTSSSSMIRVFIDRATDTRDDLDEEYAAPLFKTVFPMIEDLVIHFTNETTDEIFNLVLRPYNDGNYPVCPGIFKAGTTSPSIGSMRDEDEDSHSYIERTWSLQAHKVTGRESTFEDMDLPALPQSPTTAGGSVKMFRQFKTANTDSVIDVQNALRAVLSYYFPAGSTSYSQHYFPTIPQADRLWKSVWSCDETDSLESRTVDQIIALGGDDRVSKDFCGQIAGRIERLGTKRNGASRSGRLDIRYLIANAMQTFSTLPPDSRSHINPTSDPLFLATLLVPHVEAYLATNTDIRFLVLTYTTSDLSVVLALQNIIGSDTMKVAGILNSSDLSPSSSLRRSRTISLVHPLSNESTSTKPPLSHLNRARSTSFSILDDGYQFPSPPSNHKPEKVSFSKVNYLLPSTATDAESASFFSSIWGMLMEISDFYTPEPEPKPIIVERVVERMIERPALPSPSVSSHPPVSYRTPRELRQASSMSRDSKIARLIEADAGGRPGSFVSKKKGLGYASSNGSTTTVRTTNSTWREGKDVDGSANYFVGDDDSGDDAYDRMILGRSGVKPLKQSQKAGKKKALKWLGLA